MDTYEIKYKEPHNPNIEHIFDLINENYKKSTTDEDNDTVLTEELPYPDMLDKCTLYKAILQEKSLVEDRVRNNTRTIIHCETYNSEGGLDNAKKSLVKNKNKLNILKNKIS